MDTQYYDPALGRQGNIEKILRETQYRKNEIENEACERRSDTAENRTAVEQKVTELYLSGMDEMQQMTSLYLEVLELRQTVTELYLEIEILKEKIK